MTGFLASCKISFIPFILVLGIAEKFVNQQNWIFAILSKISPRSIIKPMWYIYIFIPVNFLTLKIFYP